MRVFLQIEYDGAAFSGWQKQPDRTTVQGELERALATVCRQPVVTAGAGRTDAGVHATGQVAHADLPEGCEITPRLVYQANSLMPYGAAITRVWQPLRPDLHARFDALERAYTYTLLRTKRPLLRDTAWQFTGPMDVQVLQRCAALLMRYSLFDSFSKLHGGNASTQCSITESYWTFDGGVWQYHVAADRFLRGMVRAIVGTLVEAGSGRISEDEFCRIIESRHRREAANNVPAHGLCLARVRYPEGALTELPMLIR